MPKKLYEKFKSFSAVKKVIILLNIICISFFTIGYSAFSEKLNASGEIEVIVDDSSIRITSISDATLTKSASENSSATYQDATANFSYNLPKNNSTITYSVTITNFSSTNVRYLETQSTKTNSAFDYELTGLDSNTVLGYNESVTFKVKFKYSQEYQYTTPDSTSDISALTFIFSTTSTETFIDPYGSIKEDTGNVIETDLGAPITITLNNDNTSLLNLEIIGQNNFTVTDTDGKALIVDLRANSSVILNAYIKDSDSSTALGTNATISIMAKDTSNNKTYFIDTIDLTLLAKAKYLLLEDGYLETSSDTDYTQVVSSTGGLYKMDSDSGSSYYYRGVVNNNYFSFANQTWRILRLDEDANIRLILNGFLTNNSTNITQKFKSTYTATSLTNAITLAKFINDTSSTTSNSPIYGYLTDTSTTSLRGWYNNNIKSTDYEDYVVSSKFCQNTDGANKLSSGTSTQVYYFASYQKIGPDSSLYSPDFECATEHTINEYIGTISAEEYVLAGGAFGKNNTSFFLNDTTSTRAYYWTLSAAYYDSQQQKVGAFYVDSSGLIRDWPNANTITNSYAIRPVITVNGNKYIEGSGTSSDPYHFVES